MYACYIRDERTSLDKRTIHTTYEIAFGEDRNENDVVVEAHFLAFAALLRRRVKSPPAGFTCEKPTMASGRSEACDEP